MKVARDGTHGVVSGRGQCASARVTEICGQSSMPIRALSYRAAGAICAARQISSDCLDTPVLAKMLSR
jgi:hypothetical protein